MISKTKLRKIKIRKWFFWTEEKNRITVNYNFEIKIKRYKSSGPKKDFFENIYKDMGVSYKFGNQNYLPVDILRWSNSTRFNSIEFDVIE